MEPIEIKRPFTTEARCNVCNENVRFRIPSAACSDKVGAVGTVSVSPLEERPGWCHYEGHFASICGSCSKLNVLNVSFRSPAPDPTAERTYIIEVRELDSSTVVWPPCTRPVELQGLPQGIQIDLREAAACIGHGFYTAGIVMLRRVIEKAAKTKGVTNGGLKAKLKTLLDRGLIPPSVHARAEVVRGIGNVGAHSEIDAAGSDLEPFTEEDAEATSSVTVHFLMHLFALPEVTQDVSRKFPAT